jgi:hypothetical protein
MFSFRWYYDFTGAALTWAIVISFCATAIICGAVVPYFISPAPAPGSVKTAGIVLRLDTNDAMVRPVFGFADMAGAAHEFSDSMWTNRSAYRAGDHLTVVFHPDDPSRAFVEDDQDLRVSIWILRAIATIFGGIGLAVLGMKLKAWDDGRIHRVGGVIGALTYAVPASLVLPGMGLAYKLRPNAIYDADAAFGLDQWLFCALFTSTGLITFFGTIALNRYFKRVALGER